MCTFSRYGKQKESLCCEALEPCREVRVSNLFRILKTLPFVSEVSLQLVIALCETEAGIECS